MAKNEKTQKTGRIAATIAELKQVSWPSFPNVLKKLGSVLVITGMFLLVFMGFDALLKWMYSALVMGVVGTYVQHTSGWGQFVQYDDEARAIMSMSVAEMIAAAIVAAALIAAVIITAVIIKTRKSEEF